MRILEDETLIIKSISIEGLFGKNYKLNFNDKLTILYGLNGSGKTTILDIMSNLFQGNIKKLLSYNFDELIIKYKKNSVLKKIHVKRKKELDYKIEINGIEERVNLRSTINRMRELESEFYNEEINTIYLSGFEDKQKKNIIESIQQEFSSTYIPISRDLGITKRNQNLKEDDHFNSYIDQSTKVCIEILNKFIHRVKFRENRVFEVTQKLILQKFLTPTEIVLKEATKEITLKNRELNLRKDNEKIELLKKYKLDINYENLLKVYEDTLDSYCVENEKRTILDLNEYIKHIMTYEQLNKLINILEILKSRHEPIKNLYKKVQDLEVIINSFYEDTNKSLNIIEKNGNRKRSKENKTINKEIERVRIGDSYIEKLDVEDTLKLSSGEKQLFILLVASTLMPFEHPNLNFSASSNIIMIDEPELSLHIEWQRNLVKALLRSVDNQQLIIATHSPEIVGEYVSFCEEIKGELNYE